MKDETTLNLPLTCCWPWACALASLSFIFFTLYLLELLWQDQITYSNDFKCVVHRVHSIIWLQSIFLPLLRMHRKKPHRKRSEPLNSHILHNSIWPVCQTLLGILYSKVMLSWSISVDKCCMNLLWAAFNIWPHYQFCLDRSEFNDIHRENEWKGNREMDSPCTQSIFFF